MESKKLNRLITQSLAIEQEDIKTLGFMARALVQATLPHSKTQSNSFKRKNGDFQLTILSDPDIGLPYGTIPRLILAWITTEAVKTKQRELILGKNLSDFIVLFVGWENTHAFRRILQYNVT